MKNNVDLPHMFTVLPAFLMVKPNIVKADLQELNSFPKKKLSDLNNKVIQKLCVYGHCEF